MPLKPVLLDLYCKSGGAARGYQEAGFQVWGVDIEPQPNYVGERFYQADALEFLAEFCQPLGQLSQADWRRVRAIHASPPCQAWTVYGNNSAHVRADHPELIDPTRALLERTGLPWVMENVPGAPLRDPIRLCGTSFPPLEVRRHRLFETNLGQRGGCRPPAVPCDHGRLTERKYPGSSNRPNGRTVCNIGEWRVPLAVQQKAIGIDWMDMKELSQAVPPAYTRYLGGFLMAAVTG